MSRQSVNVYDFDYTIYRGNVSIDFIIYCMLHRPRLWKYLPGQMAALARYVFGWSTRKQLKERTFVFLQDITDTDKLLVDFWSVHKRKIAPWYGKQHRQTDIVISASNEFLLRPIIEQLGIGTLIATRMDPRTGRISGENCRGQEKVRRLRQYDATLVIDAFYSDSMADRPLFELANRPFVVSRRGIIPLSQYKSPKHRT